MKITKTYLRRLIKEVQDEKDVRKELEKKYGQVWNTEELQRDFKVESFIAGMCNVIRKKDSIKGFLQFTHMPRFYFNFIAD